MINPKEIRLGNIIKVGGDIISVTGIDNETIQGASINFPKILFYQTDLLNPITITTELLMNFGFEKNADLSDRELTSFTKFLGRVKIMFELYHYDNGEEGFHASVEHNIGMGFNDLVRPPEFIHELQNLVFALTGEEMEILSHATP